MKCVFVKDVTLVQPVRISVVDMGSVNSTIKHVNAKRSGEVRKKYFLFLFLN